MSTKLVTIPENTDDRLCSIQNRIKDATKKVHKAIVQLNTANQELEDYWEKIEDVQEVKPVAGS